MKKHIVFFSQLADSCQLTDDSWQLIADMPQLAYQLSAESVAECDAGEASESVAWMLIQDLRGTVGAKWSNYLLAQFHFESNVPEGLTNKKF